MAYAETGDVIERTLSFTEAEISAFATLAGDTNPLHHDADYAADTRFGGIIVSGPQIASTFMALIADHFSAKAAMLGLESHMYLRGPAHPNQDIDMLWVVRDVTEKPKLGGEIVTLEGKVTGPDEALIIEAEFKALVVEKL